MQLNHQVLNEDKCYTQILHKHWTNLKAYKEIGKNHP